VDLNFNNCTIYNYQFFNDTNTFVIAGGNQQSINGRLGVQNDNIYRYLWENTATFHRTFGEKHDLTVLAGTTTEESKSTAARAASTSAILTFRSCSRAT